MLTKKEVNLNEYKELIETIAKVEFKKMSTSCHLFEYLELVNIGNHTIYLLFKNYPNHEFNNSYLSTAIKWAIRNEVRRRYRWYSLKNKPANPETQEDIREAVYKSILSIDEMAEGENPKQIQSKDRNPEETLEFRQIKHRIENALERLPQREREFIEQKFFHDKKLREMAIEYDISPSRISRIIQQGLNRIKKELNMQGMM